MNKIAIGIIIIGIIIPIAAVAQLLTIDAEKHLRYLDGPDDELTIKLHDDDQEGEFGFSFWIKSNFTDSDGNGLWDDCEAFNASVMGPDGNETERYIPMCDNKDNEFKDIGLMKVGEACKSVKYEINATLEENTIMRCPDGDYVITANSEARVRYDDEAIGEAVMRVLLTGAGCCCGTLIILLGIILAFTMADPQDTYMGDNQDSNLFNQAAAETGLKSSSGWDEKEDYIRKDSTEEVEETKKEAPETDQKKGEYNIPPPE